MKDFFHKKNEDHHIPPGYRHTHAAGDSLSTQSSFPWKWYAKIALIIITFLGSLGLLLLHPFFQVHSVEIQGLQRIQENDIRDTVNGILSYKRFFLFPQNNYFLADIDDLHSILQQKYPLKSLTIQKSFPHTLKITVEEKLSTIIYDNGEQYSLVDATGKVSEILRIVDDSEWRVIKKLVTSTDATGTEVSTEQILSRSHTPNYKKILTEVGDYPLVYDTRNKHISKGDQILNDTTVQSIIGWYEVLKHNSDIPFTYFYLEREVGDVTIKTSEGWTIKAKLDNKIDQQFQTLEYILHQKVKRPEIQYIDVRFPGRAFWL